MHELPLACVSCLTHMFAIRCTVTNRVHSVKNVLAQVLGPPETQTWTCPRASVLLASVQGSFSKFLNDAWQNVL